MSFIVYKLLFPNGETYVGRTRRLSQRLEEHRQMRGHFTMKVLGKYMITNVHGWGKIEPRLEYLWYQREKPTLNKICAGGHYFKRDNKRHSEVIKNYEHFETKFRITDFA